MASESENKTPSALQNVSISDSIEFESNDMPLATKSPDDILLENLSTKPAFTMEAPISVSKVPQAQPTFAESSNNFGQTSFGKSSEVKKSTPSFGQSTMFGGPKIDGTFGTTTFGAPNTEAIFMPTSSPSTMFGAPSTAGSSTNVFGTSNTYGTLNTAAPSITQPVTSFAQSASAFGLSNSSFAQSTPISGQTASAFGNKTPIFGQSPSFGNSNSNSQPQAVNNPSAPQNQGFGSFSKPAFGQSNFSFGSGSNSFAALSGVSSPSPAATSFAGLAQSGVGVPQVFDVTTTVAAAPLGPGQSLAGNVSFGARSGLGVGSNAPAFGLAQPSFPK